MSPRAADFDPFSDGYQQDPPEYVRWAREQEPVFYSPVLGYWVVTRYDDVADNLVAWCPGEEGAELAAGQAVV